MRTLIQVRQKHEIIQQLRKSYKKCIAIPFVANASSELKARTQICVHQFTMKPSLFTTDKYEITLMSTH